MARREAMGWTVGLWLVVLGAGAPESLAVAHQITASVVNEAQMLLVGIKVELRLQDGTVIRSKTTSSSGVARFSRVPDGEYRVVPRSKGYLFTPEVQEVSLGPTSGNVTLPPFVGAATYVGARWVVPGAIEFEDFDDGAQGVAFYDRTTRNEGGKYRDTRVDLERCDDLGGGYDIFKAAKGEWLRYSVLAPMAGEYRIELRVGLSPKAQGSVTLRWDDDPAKTLGPVVIPKGPPSGPTIWTTIPISGTVSLTQGDHAVKILFHSGTAGARFNHLVVARVWPQPSAGPTVIDVMGLVPGEVDDTTAILNGQRIQQAIEALPSSGGIVRVPAGTFFVRQAVPMEGQFVGSEANAAIYVTRGDVVLRGAGAGQTILVAKNRATSFLQIGNRYEHDGLGIGIHNVTIERITFRSRPFIAPDGSVDLVGLTNRGCVGVIDCNVTLGGQITVFGNSPQEWIEQVEIRACEFLDLHTLAVHLIHTKGVRILNNRFVFFSTGIPATYQALDFAHPKVGVFAGALRVEDIELLANTFTGNGAMASPTDRAADGFVWLSQGGNWLIADNMVENYRFEGVQLTAGPATVVHNQFMTLSDNPSSNALAVHHGNAYGPSVSSPGSLYASFSFVGNTVRGGSVGVLAQPPHHLDFNAAFDLAVTSNAFELVAQSSQTENPSTAVILGYVREARISGNTNGLSGRAVHFATINDGRETPVAARLHLRCNEFQRLSWGAFLSQEYRQPALEEILFVANILGRGNEGFAYVQFDNVYPYASDQGALTHVTGIGNTFFNNDPQSGGFEEFRDSFTQYFNRDAIEEDLREDDEVFSLL